MQRRNEAELTEEETRVADLLSQSLSENLPRGPARFCGSTLSQ